MALPVKVKLVCSVCHWPLSLCYFEPGLTTVAWALTQQSLEHLDTHNAATAA